MLTIAVPMLLFTGIVAALAGVVLWVRVQLSARLPVRITINDQRRLDVTSGDTLLATLTGAGIHLPSACGGRGTCGQCRVILEQGGGGELLPVERNHINRRDGSSGARLACMLKVREDLEVTVPAELLSARQWQCRVRSNRSLSTYLTELILEMPEDQVLSFRAGDYLMVQAPVSAIDFRGFEIASGYRREWEQNDLFRFSVEITEPTSRAYSLANAPDEAGRLTLVVRIALPPPNAPDGAPPGLVSSYIFSLRAGDSVSVSGPFGNFHATGTAREMVLIGGGAGIAPMRAIIRDQLLGKRGGADVQPAPARTIHFFYGSRNQRELVYADEFRDLAARFENFHYEVALSAPEPADNWSGSVGLVHSLVYERYLKDHPEPEAAEYYLCGPPLMSSAVLAMLEDLGVDRENIFYDDFGTPSGGRKP